MLKRPEINLPVESRQFLDDIKNGYFRSLIMDTLQAGNCSLELSDVQRLSDELWNQKTAEFLELVRSGETVQASNIAEHLEGCQISLQRLEGYREAVEQGVIESFKHDHTNSDAPHFIERFCRGIDFRNLKGFKEAMIGRFLKRLREGYEPCCSIGLELGMGIDFSKAEGYEEAVKEGLLASLRKGGTANTCDKILLLHGPNLILAQIDGYREAVSEGILESLREGDRKNTEKFINRYGKGINIGEIDGYKEAVAKGLFDLFDRGEDEAFEFIEAFGKEIDFSQIPGHKEAVGKMALNFISVGDLSMFEKIHTELGVGSIAPEELADAVKRGVTWCLKEGNPWDAFMMLEKVDAELGEGSIAPEELADAITKGFTWCLRQGNPQGAINIFQVFKDQIDTSSIDLRAAAQGAFVYEIGRRGTMADYFKILTEGLGLTEELTGEVN